MKKKILAIAMAAVMILALAACGSDSSSSSSSGSSSSSSDSGSEAAADLDLAETSWEPSTTVSIVIPAGAGGDTDLTARVFAEYAKKITGHDFIVVNANGAAGSVAANQVLSSANDGHTFLYGHNLVNVAYVSGVSDYNYTAFTLGPTFARNPVQQFYVNPSKYDGLDSFIEAAKADPGKLQACTEVGGYTYYELLAFEKAADIDLDLVDVGSNSDKITAMLSGQVDMMPGAYLSCVDYMEAGQFLCLGVPSEERYTDLMPDIPTLVEQGIDFTFPDCDYSFYFPADTDAEIIAWYDNVVQQIYADAGALQAIKDINVIPYYLNPADSEANDANYLAIFEEVAASVS